MSDRLDEILTKAGVPKGFHKIIGTNKLSNIDTFTEAKQALQSYIDTKIIEARIDELQKLNDWTINGMKTVDDICYHLDQKIYVLDGRIKALNHRKER